jgi:uridylate kinase
LRAEQIGADIILKGTKVDGVYDSDPKLFANAVKYDEVDFMAIIKQGLRIMDLTAITFCRDYNIPVLVFNILEPGNLNRIISGHSIGTLVKEIKQ